MFNLCFIRAKNLVHKGPLRECVSCFSQSDREWPRVVTCLCRFLSLMVKQPALETLGYSKHLPLQKNEGHCAVGNLQCSRMFCILPQIHAWTQFSFWGSICTRASCSLQSGSANVSLPGPPHSHYPLPAVAGCQCLQGLLSWPKNTQNLLLLVFFYVNIIILNSRSDHVVL